jgi:hypothetical protein
MIKGLERLKILLINIYGRLTTYQSERKLVVSVQPSVFYGTMRFITLFTRTLH